MCTFYNTVLTVITFYQIYTQSHITWIDVFFIKIGREGNKIVINLY